MEAVEQSMRQAEQSLEQSRQARGAQQQQEASEALDQANEALQRNRPLSQDQREKMEQLAKKQEELEEDILQLAQLAEELKNREAARKLEEAAQAAQQAQESMENGEQDDTEQQQEEVMEKLEEAMEALEEELDRYMDLRQEELLFRMKDELMSFLEKQQPITEETKATRESLAEGNRMTRRMRRKLNQLGERERDLADKAEFLHSALEEEGVLVFTHILRSNEDDLNTVGKQLSGSSPDPGDLTIMLQEDVEARTAKLLDALSLEQKRRREEQQRRQEQREQEEQQQQQPDNNGQQRQRLVSVIAELEMLLQMEQEMMGRTGQMERLIKARGGDGITELESALIERLANRHNEITQIFLEMKKMVEQTLNPQGQDGGRDR